MNYKAEVMEFDSETMLRDARAVILALQALGPAAPADGFDRKAVIAHISTLILAVELVRLGAGVPDNLMGAIHDIICRLIEDVASAKAEPSSKLPEASWVAKGPERAS